MKAGWAITLCLSVLLAGCNAKQPADRVTSVADDDPKMNAAIARAKAGVDQFIAVFQSPGSRQSGFSIKFPFREGDAVEHMWVAPLTYDAGQFRGTVGNEPEKVSNVRYGELVTIPAAEISDWMYVDDGKLVGGETLRVLRDTLSPEDRKEFDAGLSFVIE